jgi:hypothetical protein
MAAVLASANQSGGSSTPPASSSSNASTTSDTPPVIQINGTNPAIIHVGDTYADLGATITGPQADLNLGIRTYLNGAPVNTIQIDTTQVATDTIQQQTGIFMPTVAFVSWNSHDWSLASLVDPDPRMQRSPAV